MDPLDRASDRAVAYQYQPTEALRSRSLSAAELHQVISHLLDTEMPVPDALHALRLGLDVATMDDVMIIMQQIARCKECRTWTRLTDLDQAACPACRAEASAPAEELEES